MDTDFIQEQIGYRFRNPDLLQQAFVRRSYAREKGGEDNEVLEFIGDKVLDLVVVKLLAQKHGYLLHECDDFDDEDDYDEFSCEKDEAELTELKKMLTQRKTLAQRIEVLSLAGELIMGKGDVRRRADREDSVREDLFEAILGAVAIDCDWDMQVLESTVEIMLDPDSILQRDAPDNYVSIIHNWYSGEYGGYPEFHYENADYYRDQMNLMYPNEIRSQSNRNSSWMINISEYNRTHFKCWLDLLDKRFIGFGSSKSQARRDVCELLYTYLEEHDLLLTIRDELDDPNRDEAISQLEILARRGYFSIPVYDFSQSYDADGNPVWKSVCRIPERDRSFSARASSKKEAKKAAAYQMLTYVLKE